MKSKIEKMKKALEKVCKKNVFRDDINIKELEKGIIKCLPPGVVLKEMKKDRKDKNKIVVSLCGDPDLLDVLTKICEEKL